MTFLPCLLFISEAKEDGFCDTENICIDSLINSDLSAKGNQTVNVKYIDMLNEMENVIVVSHELHKTVNYYTVL